MQPTVFMGAWVLEWDESTCAKLPLHQEVLKKSVPEPMHGLLPA